MMATHGSTKANESWCGSEYSGLTARFRLDQQGRECPKPKSDRNFRTSIKSRPLALIGVNGPRSRLLSAQIAQSRAS
ncbi:hypothetical protein CBOM_07629 [Ceraceosorus bombacis]|uniref:Uncharacterized protein n=1 Tax=Ceraceosorus bombacis TaxID=401625 RepID=A0A0N7LAL5_9BASI|nr:hypothetical protein CBOM_07629 [Ceraceosorus bombacis]